MKRKKLILNALILTVSSLSLSFISMAFRVYLSRNIKAEGMGLFQLIMSVYFMATTISISGIRVTTTRLIAEELGKQNFKNINYIMKNALIYSLIFGIVMFLGLYYNSEFISNNFIKDYRAIIPIKILSYSLPFVSVSACFHGYFYGMRKVVKSISSDIVENIVMMAIIVLFMSFYINKGLSFTCALIAVGTSVGNVFGAFYFYLLYLFEKKSSTTHKSKNHTFKNIFKISFPIACSSYIQMGLKTAEDMLIPYGLRKFGASSSSTLEIFGVIKGMALPILFFPSVFLASFSTLIIPEISEANALKNNKRVNYIISKVFKFTLLISVFSTGLFMIFSDEIGNGLYNNSQVGIMLKILAPLIPFMYLDRIVDGSLNALDKQMDTLKFNLIDMAIRMFLILHLIPKKGIPGFIFVLFCGTLVNSTLSISKLLKVTKLPFRLYNWIILPSICIFLAGTSVKFIASFVGLSLTLIIISTMILYFLLLFVSGCIKTKDVFWFVDAFKYQLIGENLFEFNLTKRF